MRGRILDLREEETRVNNGDAFISNVRYTLYRAFRKLRKDYRNVFKIYFGPHKSMSRNIGCSMAKVVRDLPVDHLIEAIKVVYILITLQDTGVTPGSLPIRTFDKDHLRGII